MKLRRLIFAGLSTILVLPIVNAQDATELVRQLGRERCDVFLGQLTDDPHALTSAIFQPAPNAKINEYSFEDEIWIGEWGTRVIERYLIFHPQADGYKLVDCIPFRAMGRSSISIEGRNAESMTFGIYDRTPNGYDMFTVSYLLESERRVLIAAERIAPYLYQSDISEWKEPIEDPWQWAEIRFSIDLGSQRESIWGFEVDLDSDGVNELGITTSASHGNGGGAYGFFREDGNAYRFIGYLELRTLQVLPPTSDGSMRIRTFWRTSINCETSLTHSNDGLKFIELEISKSCDDAATHDRQLTEAEIVRPELLQFRPESWTTAQ